MLHARLYISDLAKWKNYFEPSRTPFPPSTWTVLSILFEVGRKRQMLLSKLEVPRFSSHLKYNNHCVLSLGKKMIVFLVPE